MKSLSIKLFNLLFLLISSLCISANVIKENEGINKNTGETELTTGEAMFRWISFAQAIGASADAAVLDIEKAVESNSDYININDSYVIMESISKHRDMFNVSNNSTEVETSYGKRSGCQVCGYAGSCVWTCNSGSSGLTPCEDKCTKSALVGGGIGTTVTGGVSLLTSAGLGLFAIPLSMGLSYTACLAMC